MESSELLTKSFQRKMKALLEALSLTNRKSLLISCSKNAMFSLSLKCEMKFSQLLLL